MFNRGIGLTFWHMETFSEQFEMVNQIFHIGLHAFAIRRRDFIIATNYWTRILTQPINTLLDDAIRLSEFLNTHQIAVIAIAIHAHWDIKI